MTKYYLALTRDWSLGTFYETVSCAHYAEPTTTTTKACVVCDSGRTNSLAQAASGQWVPVEAGGARNANGIYL